MISGEQRRNRLIVGALGVATVALLVGYPLMVTSGRDAMGVRPLALMLVGMGALLAPLTRRFLRRTLGAETGRSGPGPGRGKRNRVLVVGALCIPTVLGLAIASGERVFLQLVPAVVYGITAGIFAASLGAPVSLMERAVRTLIPSAPEFIAEYCRGLTRFWAWFFAGAAAIAAALAVAGPATYWTAFTTWGVPAAMVVVWVVEFAVRKTRFRYYYIGGPIDRVWAHFFPAEATPLGRQSLAYIRKRREQLRREQAEATRGEVQEDPKSPSR